MDSNRKVKNRFHYFVKRTFSAADSGPQFELEINVPFPVDDLIVRDVANVDLLYDYEEIKAGASTAAVAVPNQYVYTLALDGVGTLCSFTNKCYMKLDNTFKLNGRLIGGAQRFRVLNPANEEPVVGAGILSYFTAHLEFVVYADS